MMSSSSSSLLSASPCTTLLLPFPKPIFSFRWRLQSEHLAYSGSRRGDRLVLQVIANTNAPRGKRNKSYDAIMVDPTEAKRLAAQQMQEIQSKEKRKRKRRIEAINGAWAMIGLTAGLVVEGRTGHGILGQVADYLAAITGFFTQITQLFIKS